MVEICIEELEKVKRKHDIGEIFGKKTVNRKRERRRTEKMKDLRKRPMGDVGEIGCVEGRNTIAEVKITRHYARF